MAYNFGRWLATIAICFLLTFCTNTLLERFAPINDWWVGFWCGTVWTAVCYAMQTGARAIDALADDGGPETPFRGGTSPEDYLDRRAVIDGATIRPKDRK